MHSRTAEVLTHLGQFRAVLRDAVDQVPPSQREQRPAPDRWSVAEILEHLGIVERGITGLLRKQLEVARAAGLGQEQATDSVLPLIPIQQVVDRDWRIEANARVQPTGGLTAAAAWQVLLDRRQKLRRFLEEADGLALGELMIPVPHPRLGLLNGWQWLVFLGAHEGRHAAQIREQAGAVTGASSR
jgi:uncharacterized damage-inducible protein DinB